MSHVCIRLRCRNLGFLQILRKHPGDSSAKKKKTARLHLQVALTQVPSQRHAQ